MLPPARIYRPLLTRALICLGAGPFISVVIAWAFTAYGFAPSTQNPVYWKPLWVSELFEYCRRPRVLYRPVAVNTLDRWWLVKRASYGVADVCIWFRGDESFAKGVAAEWGTQTHPVRGARLSYPIMSNESSWPVEWSGPSRWSNQLTNVHFVTETAAGFPERCLSGTELEHPTGSTTIVCMAKIGNWRCFFRPIPSGLALDTTFYASILFALWSAALFTRSSLRRRRGQCPRCKYPLRGLTPDPTTNLLTCPECGSSSHPTPAQ